MNSLLTILRKAIVNQFYRQNAGLFFVALMLAGSFLRLPEHMALAEAAVHAPFLLGLYQVFWLLYTLFATRFAIGVIRQTEVLYHYRLIPTPQRWLGLFATNYALLSPVLGYTAFVGWISWQQRTTASTAQLMIGAVFMLVMPLFWLDYSLRTPNRQSRTVRFGTDWHDRFTTPYSLFFIRHLVNDEPVLLFFTKIGTCLLVFGILVLYPTDDYDSRLLALGALVMALSHSTMMYHLYQFEHERLAVLRNLPVLTGRRLLSYALIVGLLLLPEAILLLRYHPAGVSFGVLAGTWAFGHSVMLLEFTLLFPRHRQLDQLMPLIFGLLLVFFLAIMYQLPAWGLNLINWTAAIVLFIHYYLKSAWVTEISD